jgi:hypothetical protein
MPWTISLEPDSTGHCIELEFEHDDEAYAAVHALRFSDMYQATLTDPDGQDVKVVYGRQNIGEAKEAAANRAKETQLIAQLRESFGGDQELVLQELQQLVDSFSTAE